MKWLNKTKTYYRAKFYNYMHYTFPREFPLDDLSNSFGIQLVSYQAFMRLYPNIDQIKHHS